MVSGVVDPTGMIVKVRVSLVGGSDLAAKSPIR